MSQSQRQLRPRPPGDSPVSSPLGHVSSSNSGIPAKRQLVKAACLACRAKKIKCNGDRPTCGACAKLYTACAYDVYPGQGSKDRSKNEASSALEFLGFLQTQSEQKAADFLSFIRSADKLDLNALSAYIHVSGGESSSLERNASQTQSSESSYIPALNPHALLVPGHRATMRSATAAVKIFAQACGAVLDVFTQDQDAEAVAYCERSRRKTLKEAVDQKRTTSDGAMLAEICAMAAAGALYIRVSRIDLEPADLDDTLMADMSAQYYGVAKHLLDDAIKTSPLRAMKVCILLAMSNIVLHASVALAYADMGLSVGQHHDLLSRATAQGMSDEDTIVFNKTYRALTALHNWLETTLGGVQMPQPARLTATGHLHQFQNPSNEDVVRKRLADITTVKSEIIATLRNPTSEGEPVTGMLRERLRSCYTDLPSWLKLDQMPTAAENPSLRRVIIYAQLFHISAVMLLSRQLITKLATPESSVANHLPLEKPVEAGIAEGLHAAKAAARVLHVMQREGNVDKVCWLCIFTAYTASLLIIYEAVQNALQNKPAASREADIALACACTDVLRYCADKDNIAGVFQRTLTTYIGVLSSHVPTTISPAWLQEETQPSSHDQDISHLMTIPAGATDLHKAARDLLHLLTSPFDTDLLLLPSMLVWHAPFSFDGSLVHMLEGSYGVHLSWDWQLKDYGAAVPQPSRATVFTDGLSVLGESGVLPAARHFLEAEEVSSGSSWGPNAY